MNYALLITANAATHPAAHSALQFAQAALKQNHTILQIFFMHDGVYSCARYLSPPQDESNHANELITFAGNNNIPVIACHNACLRRGLLDAEDAKTHGSDSSNLHPDVKVTGLGELIKAIENADRVIEFKA